MNHDQLVPEESSSSDVSFVQMEHEILKFWQKKKFLKPA